MKNTMYLLIGILLLACNKEEKDTTPKIFKATIKENFTDPLKQIENIQVYDFVPYTITIEDEGEDSDNVEYRLTPIRQQAKIHHQTIWEDFGLYLTNDESKVHLKDDKNYISFFEKGKHNFYIRPREPGTYKHIYEFQKFKDGKPVGETIKFNISFNAVHIYAFQSHYANGEVAGFSIKVSDGEEEGDNYLSDKNISQIYKAEVFGYDKYDNTRSLNFTGDFISKKYLAIRDSKISYYKKYWGKMNFRIEQKRGDLPVYVIHYYGIYISM